MSCDCWQNRSIELQRSAAVATSPTQGLPNIAVRIAKTDVVFVTVTILDLQLSNDLAAEGSHHFSPHAARHRMVVSSSICPAQFDQEKTTCSWEP